MPRSFQARLKACMRSGNLRTADLARWFERRHSTVRGWVIDGRAPAGTKSDIDLLNDQVERLELLIKAKGKEWIRSYIKTVRR